MIIVTTLCICVHAHLKPVIFKQNKMFLKQKYIVIVLYKPEIVEKLNNILNIKFILSLFSSVA